jgi:hypothetical protein
MTHNKKLTQSSAFKAACLALAVSCAAAVSAVAAEPELARLQRQLEQLQRDVDAERQLHEADLARHKAWEASAKSQLTDTRTQARRARAEADSLERVLKTYGNPTQNRAEEQAKAKKEADAFAAVLADQADAVLAKVLREELPDFAESRERALRDLSRGLRSGVIAPEDGLGQLFDQLSAIIEYGRKAEARPGTYTTRDGRPVDGQYVAVGGIFEGFVSADGVVAAYRTKGEKGWQWNESLPAERRENLLKMARMLQGSEDAGFVAVPFGLVSGGEP